MNRMQTISVSALLLALGHLKAANADLVTITDDQFTASSFRWGTDFFGTMPEPDKAGFACGTSATAASLSETTACFFLANDTFLSETLPVWQAPTGAVVTEPFGTGLSTPRLLGGIATRDPTTGMYTPNMDFEVVRRGADGVGLIYNWSRIDATLDGYLRAGKVEHYMIVLDNIPFAFVRPENRFYVSYGNGAAPDNPAEFGAFVGDLVKHLVSRYGAAVVSKWRFRLGTECDGPRIGPSWENFTAPNAPFVMPGEDGRNFTTRTNGLDAYVATYVAVAKAIEAALPGAAFGPSNMAGISGGANGGGAEQACTSCYYLKEFADRVKAAGAPLGFIAASEYSKWDKNGFAVVEPMRDNPTYLRGIAAKAGHPTAPIEVHEWGWAQWGHWADAFGSMQWPMGAYGGAWSLGSYLYQRRGGTSKVYHWSYYFDNTLALGARGRGGNASGTCMPGTLWSPDGTTSCRPRGYPLVTAHGWLMAALLHADPPRHPGAAGSAGALPALSEFVADLPPPRLHAPSGGPQHEYNHTIGAIKASSLATPTASAPVLTYLVLHFSPNVTEFVRRRIQLQVAAADVSVFGSCERINVTQQVLNRTTSTHDQIEQTLFDRQQKVADEKRATDNIGNMATADGLRDLVADASGWMQKNRALLRFAPFTGDVQESLGGAAAVGCTLEFELETPSVLLLRLTKSTKSH